MPCINCKWKVNGVCAFGKVLKKNKRACSKWRPRFVSFRGLMDKAIKNEERRTII